MVIEQPYAAYTHAVTVPYIHMAEGGGGRSAFLSSSALSSRLVASSSSYPLLLVSSRGILQGEKGLEWRVRRQT